MPQLEAPLLGILSRIHADLVRNNDGALADYIPELAHADPSLFGIAVATIDGEVFGVGDTGHPFTIQSISKPLVFGMALEQVGADAVRKCVDVEPSGNAFNSIKVDATNRPFNPMVNAGAIVTTGLLDSESVDAGQALILDAFSDFAGRELRIDERVYLSELRTGDRNRALAWLMKSFGVLEGDVDQVVDIYFRQCAVEVTCRDLALIGATLANGGVNPLTGRRAISAGHVSNVLSVMSTCGMYDNAGGWLYSVGLPAKSGVSGGLLAVLPGQLGIGVFSPLLDVRGNTVRGMAVVERLSQELQLHLLHTPAGVQSVVRKAVRGNELMSNRVRSMAENRELASGREGIALFELQGHLTFAAAERAHRTMAMQLEDVEFVVIDFRRVTSADDAAIAVLNDLAERLIAENCTVIALHEHDNRIVAKMTPSLVAFENTDSALEWCEEQILERSALVIPADEAVALGDFDLLEGFDIELLAAIEAAADVEFYEPGTILFREGQRADAVAFLLQGRVGVLLPLDVVPRDRTRRVATFGPGTAFGENALLDGGVRSADVVCDERSLIALLSLDALADLDALFPALRASLNANLARILAMRLGAANAQIRALAR